ncbi:hypothetical protein E3T46_07780 [Cryobacterium sp. Hh11]|uniref:hypothetical protein n=1 Tax=Cryobacterium sp. Hh11 TaxID=2555868 RepID=UPI00106A33A2|nr:hypothetical protein [Cryobacterium sp. Hh11]TFD51979.1 hypothetical protein E3T46_07780 [Cryobacterium sp. Hh11]
MNKTQVAQILTIASGFDRFIVVDRVTTEAWFMALEKVDYDEAMAATVGHFTGPIAKEVFSVRHILAAIPDSTRNTTAAIEADVRSAKARGLIDKSWPSRNLLPADIRDALFTLREFERRQATDRLALDEMPDAPADVGMVGRSL